jgi:hypothetical protein
VWGWHLSSPVRTFARQNAKAIRRTAFFCTMGGSGADTAFAELERLIGRRPQAVLALTEDEVGKLGPEPANPELLAFVKRLREGAAAAARAPHRTSARAARSH